MVAFQARVAQLVLVLFLTATPALADGAWTEITPSSGPEPTGRTTSVAIHDPVGDRMIIFGGDTNSGNDNNVWAFDLGTHTWTDITPSSGSDPDERITPNAGYDAVTHEMIMWSGQKGSTFYNDVWAFDLTSEIWTEFSPPNPEPNKRYGTVSIFDPVGGDLVTFAGFTTSGRFDDTWRFNVELDEWTELSPSTQPEKRCLHAAAYDVLDHRMIMCCGQTSGARKDIWAFDLTTEEWTDLTPASGIDKRWWPTMVYDSTRHRVVVFGGGSPGLKQDVWEFDLATDTWTELSPTGSKPAEREGASAIYVVEEDRMIVFSGRTGGSPENDVWALDFTVGSPVVIPWPVEAAGDTFAWGFPANVDWVRGDLATVGTYTVDVSGTVTHATSFTDTDVPGAGMGFYYLFRFDSGVGSWQTVAGAEPARDTTLP